MSDARDFGAAGDGKADDTEALQHMINDGEGLLTLPAGDYRITQTLEIELDRLGPKGLDGSAGTARILMAGAGPAIRLVGTHGGTGDPTSVKPEVWKLQRMPTLLNLVIEGQHPEADGIELVGTMQSVLEGVLIRGVRHGVHLIQRNRNVLISHCHIYNNQGVGIFLEGLNLHQINIASSHISYNRLGGIRIERSEVRNLQITGNDIEYNNHRVFETDPEPTAEIYIDTTAEGASVNEVTVASNTIQATPSPGGANIRILNKRGEGRPPGLWSISGNIIGSQENNLHLTGCYGMAISGNCIYSCTHRNVLLEDSSQIAFSGNVSRRHTVAAYTGWKLIGCSDCVISGCTIEDETEAGQTTGASPLELEDCQRINISGSQFLGGVPYGIDAVRVSQVNVSNCTLVDAREKTASLAAVKISGQGAGNLLLGNTYGKTVEEPLQLAEEAGVTTANNVSAN